MLLPVMNTFFNVKVIYMNLALDREILILYIIDIYIFIMLVYGYGNSVFYVSLTTIAFIFTLCWLIIYWKLHIVTPPLIICLSDRLMLCRINIIYIFELLLI